MAAAAQCKAAGLPSVGHAYVLPFPSLPSPSLPSPPLLATTTTVLMTTVSKNFAGPHVHYQPHHILRLVINAAVQQLEK